MVTDNGLAAERRTGKMKYTILKNTNIPIPTHLFFRCVLFNPFSYFKKFHFPSVKVRNSGLPFDVLNGMEVAAGLKSHVDAVLQPVVSCRCGSTHACMQHLHIIVDVEIGVEHLR